MLKRCYVIIKNDKRTHEVFLKFEPFRIRLEFPFSNYIQSKAYNILMKGLQTYRHSWWNHDRQITCINFIYAYYYIVQNFIVTSTVGLFQMQGTYLELLTITRTSDRDGIKSFLWFSSHR